MIFSIFLETHKRSRWSLAFALLLTPVLLIGCGSDGPTTYEVSGTVTFEGTPVEEGEIIFRSADGVTGSWAGKIIAGKYTIQSTNGQKSVSITAYEKTDSDFKAESGEDAKIVTMYIPEKYNKKTELTAEITSETNEYDFDLKK